MYDDDDALQTKLEIKSNETAIYYEKNREFKKT